MGVCCLFWKLRGSVRVARGGEEDFSRALVIYGERLLACLSFVMTSGSGGMGTCVEERGNFD